MDQHRRWGKIRKRRSLQESFEDRDLFTGLISG
jgi:hypothetical protein